MQHVRNFLAICDEPSSTHAAQKCGIKQPSLGEAIKRMEQAIGGDLFLPEKACAMSISFEDAGRFTDPTPTREDYQ
jgi:DNA-binding transcriptional LysR family regulator